MAKKILKTVALIPAAGMGKRMGKDRGKQFLMLNNMPILAHTLKAFEGIEEVDEVILIVPGGEEEFCLHEIVEKYGIHKVSRITAGGKERQESVYKGLKLAPEDTGYILIHDGVRPFISKDLVKQAIELAKEADGVVLGAPAKDTIKRVSKDMFVQATMNRGHLWHIQTPQVFKFRVINEAYNRAFLDNYHGTDDASLVERLGYKIRIIMGSYENIKITTPGDMIFAEMIYKKMGDK